MPLLDHLEVAKLLKPQQMSTRVTCGGCWQDSGYRSSR